MSSQYYLIVVIPDQEPISYLISGEKVTLGRAPDNDIQLLVAEVSTHHCEFSQGEDGYQIIDVGSSNGTRVKGQSITNGRVFLNDRDMILLGETIPSYFVCLEEGAEIDPREIIQSIEKKDEERKIKQAAPVVGTAPKLPTFKAAAPTADPTQVGEAQSGASTVVLKKIPSLKAVPHVAAKKEEAAAVPAPAVVGKVPPLAAKQEAPKIKLPGQSAPAVKKLPIRKLPKINLPKKPGES